MNMDGRGPPMVEVFLCADLCGLVLAPLDDVALLAVRAVCTVWKDAVAALPEAISPCGRLALLHTLVRTGPSARREVLLLGEHRAGKSVLHRQICRMGAAPPGAHGPSATAVPGELMRSCVESLRSLVEACDAERIEIRNETAIQRMELLLHETDAAASDDDENAVGPIALEPTTASLLRRLWRDPGIQVAARLPALRDAVENLPLRLDRVAALALASTGRHPPFGLPSAVQPSDGLLAHTGPADDRRDVDVEWPLAHPSALRVRLSELNWVRRVVEARDPAGNPDASLRRCASSVLHQYELVLFAASLADATVPDAGSDFTGVDAAGDGSRLRTRLARSLEYFESVVPCLHSHARLLVVLSKSDALARDVARPGGLGQLAARWPGFLCPPAQLRADGGVRNGDDLADAFARHVGGLFVEAAARADPQRPSPRVVPLCALDARHVRASLWPCAVAKELGQTPRRPASRQAQSQLEDRSPRVRTGLVSGLATMLARAVLGGRRSSV